MGTNCEIVTPISCYVISFFFQVCRVTPFPNPSSMCIFDCDHLDLYNINSCIAYNFRDQTSRHSLAQSDKIWNRFLNTVLELRRRRGIRA